MQSVLLMCVPCVYVLSDDFDDSSASLFENEEETSKPVCICNFTVSTVLCAHIVMECVSVCV